MSHLTNKAPISTNGIVTTPHYLASQAGLEILQQGGNAVDAAIAAAATLTVVYPHMNSLGGDNFWLIYNIKKRELKGLNASGRAGEKATIDLYQSQGYDRIPFRGYLAANTVPGAVSGWDLAYKYAQASINNSLPWQQLFASAIKFSENGFPTSQNQASWTQISIDVDKEFFNLQRFSGFRQIYLKPDGTIYQTGEIFKQSHLAQSLAAIASQGAAEFYQGEIAQNIVADLQENGGILTLRDFAEHTANWVEPISVNYRDYIAYNLPPNTQGIASLSILNILNNFDLRKLGEGTADYYHLIVEATKQAFSDRDKYVSDPDFVNMPLDWLLSSERGKELAAQINLQQAANQVQPLDPKGDTIWLGVVDKDGNAVSLIQSIYYEFGSGIVAGDTGILLQNRGCFFSLDPQHVNCLQPKKRTFHTLNPAMLFQNGKPYLVYGTMGGEGQPQTQAAIATRIVDFGFNVEDAISAPRWLQGRTWGVATNELKIEGRVSADIVRELSDRGHSVKVVEDYTDVMGHAGAILIDAETNIKYGAADPRSDGAAVGY
ncbi:MAG: Glutathione hydrolase-like YwrD proenzyme [Chroococcidiopsis cubana SAG 39.79]|uniref:Glutathione hydrolase proenzyme n=1 Tax=Chroococcidiopsis cubana SAG 39.79 TaxID=388085 RepID=A0AB37USC8_9CYAN|nr:gamma-glutamyltransferase [Chroococcidiopsis cubana]MDZ4878332.1 Glutathione hydrolase-like YwrD proenzyme [Chroococcidiopsis cubana SAG 39.79]PSB63395.1 gamma-glutamyltransferase [Chroococcidiopsis cubana CCALA 043]RUT14303.1 gamma-glutamyltranspeptidase [Chroococcidiopsis cubana SAG 39.79]